jgi:hypothetical protein
MTTTSKPLTLAQTDELILAASRPEDGAIEDCGVSQLQAPYFFESGA